VEQQSRERMGLSTPQTFREPTLLLLPNPSLAVLQRTRWRVHWLNDCPN
jgi:hypothetical protein